MRSRVVASRLLTVVLVATVVLLVVAVSFRRSEHGPTDATALLVTNRTSLKVCVQSLGAAVEPGAIRDLVRAGLARVSEHPDFVPAGLGRRPVEVHEGCSAVASIDQPNYRSSSRLGAPVSVDEASPYRLMVFVAPAARMAMAFDGRDPAVTAQEVLCGHRGTCPVVTTAAYLSPASLSDPRQLDRALTEGVGLRPVTPSP